MRHGGLRRKPQPGKTGIGGTQNVFNVPSGGRELVRGHLVNPLDEPLDPLGPRQLGWLR